jgi:hypothetical protein
MSSTKSGWDPLDGVRLGKPGESGYVMTRAEVVKATQTEKWGFNDRGGRFTKHDPIGVKEFLKRTRARVRLATPRDRSEIVRLIRSMYEKGDLPSLNEQWLEQVLNRLTWYDPSEPFVMSCEMLSPPEDGIKDGKIFVVEALNSIQAMSAFVLERHWYDGGFYLRELFTYVPPMNPGFAEMLITHVRKEAKQGRVRLEMTAATDREVKSRRRQFGCYPAGVTFVCDSTGHPITTLSPDVFADRVKIRRGERAKKRVSKNTPLEKP